MYEFKVNQELKAHEVLQAINMKNEGQCFKREGWGGFWKVIHGKVVVFTKEGDVTGTPHIEHLFHDDWQWVEVK